MEIGLPMAELKLRRPFGSSLVWAFFFLIGIVASLETIARLPSVEDTYHPFYSVGSPHLEFEGKLNALDQFVQHNDLDCLFLGSSEVQRAILPEAFNSGYQQETGRDIHCFNFGVGGTGQATWARLAAYLITEYRPKLVIFGTAVHGFSDQWGDSAFDVVGKNPWLLYKTGEFNWEGWLTDHSFAYRWYLSHRNWMAPNFYWELQARDNYMVNMSADGYDYQPLSFNVENISVPPDREVLNQSVPDVALPVRDRILQQQTLFRVLADYEISQEKLEMFGKILDLGQDIPFVIVEVPVHPTFFVFYGDITDYTKAANLLDDFIRNRNIEYWRAYNFTRVPDEGWRDWDHMNFVGAQTFSFELGQGIGEAVAAKFIPDPTR